MHRSITAATLGLAIAASLLLTGCGGATPAASKETGERTDLATVTVVSPERVTLARTTTQPATVHALYSANVYAKVSGYVKELKADIGDDVEKKAPLAILWVPEMTKQNERQAKLVLQYEADEKRAEANVKLAEANVRASQAARDQAESQLAGHDAQLAADESEFVRVTDLVEKRSVADKLLDEARNRRDAARATRGAAESAVGTAEANIAVAEAKLAAAKADLDSARAQTEVERKRVEELDELMKYAVLDAPFAGKVTRRNVDPGDLVRNAQTTAALNTPLFTVDDVSQVRIRIAVPEADAPWVDEGDKVTLRLRALGAAAIAGTVTRHTHRLDDSTRTLGVEVVLDNSDGRLLPGMFGEATIDLEQHPDALVLPASAVRYDETGRGYVYVLGGDDTVSVVDVTTGLDDGKRIEITSDLDASARIVDAIVGRLQEGQKVRVP